MPSVTSKDGTTITYDVRGDGPLLILVLGALNKRGSGKKLTEQLSDSYRVVSYDRRGRGDSDDTQPYDTDKEVDDIEAIIQDLGGSCYLYGHSSGSVLVLLATARLGSAVKGMALYELPANADPAAQAGLKAYRQQLRDALQQDDRGEAVTLFVKSVGVSDKQIAAMERLPMWKGLTAMAPTLAYDTIQLMEQYPDIAVEQINVPALVLYGADSPAFMGDTARTLAAALPQAELRSLPEQTHDVRADVLAPVLHEFYGHC